MFIQVFCNLLTDGGASSWTLSVPLFRIKNYNTHTLNSEFLHYFGVLPLSQCIFNTFDCWPHCCTKELNE